MISQPTHVSGLSLLHKLALDGIQVQHIAWSSDGQKIAAGFVHGRIRIWDIGDKDSSIDLQGHSIPPISVAWSLDNQTIASISNKTVCLWDIDTKVIYSKIETKAEFPGILAWSEDKQHLNIPTLVGEEPEQELIIQSWELKTGKVSYSYTEPSWDKAFLAASTDRALLALALANNAIQVWDLRKLELLSSFQERHNRIYSVAQSSDGRIIAVALKDGRIILWDLEAQCFLTPLIEHDKPSHSLAFSNTDYQLLASKSFDNTVRLWRCDTWELVATYEERSVGRKEVELAFNPVYPMLATFGRKNTIIHIWDIDINSLLMFGGDMIKIMFVTADPTNVSRLRLQEEYHEIEKELKLSKFREQFEFIPKLGVQPEDLSRALLDVEPKVVHFSGHGTQNGALVFENKMGEAFPIAPEDLAALFEMFADQVNCVILNACYSESQAEAIVKHISYVIGMNQAIGDKAAIAFSIGFYQALGAGRSVEDAYKFGCRQIRLQGVPEHLTPVLIKKGIRNATNS